MNLRERLSTLYDECWQVEYDSAINARNYENYELICRPDLMALYKKHEEPKYEDWLRAHLKDSIVSSLYDEYVSKL